MAIRASINQKVQFGVETTSGTSVAANKSLNWGDVKLGIESDEKEFTATGHKYASIKEQNMEWSSGSMDGELDYNAIVYPLSGAMGAATIGAAESSITAKQWVFSPPITGNASPKTYTIEQGDSVRAHKLTYGLFTSFGYKGTRKDFTCSAKLIGQLISDGITMTSSPTSIALAPMVGKQFNVYLDDENDEFGTTQLTKVISVDYMFDSIYNPAWFINRSNPSWAEHVDTKPKATFKLMLEADSNGMGFLTQVRSGDTRYIRVEAVGDVIASDGPGDINHTFIHDMAVKIGKPSPWQDSDGIYAIEYECTIVEDLTWGSGKAQEITLINLLAAL